MNYSLTPEQIARLEVNGVERTISIDIPGYKQDCQISSKDFPYLGLDLVEKIWVVDENQRKLMWARRPFNKLVIDGVPNPIVHANFIFREGEGDSTEQAARRRVKEAFDKWAKEVGLICGGGRGSVITEKEMEFLEEIYLRANTRPSRTPLRTWS